MDNCVEFYQTIKSPAEPLEVSMLWMTLYILNRKSFPSAYVFNLDPSYKPGSHWVAVYIDRNGLPEYFDSFAHPPPREIKDFLYTCAESWNYNHVPIQELYSTTCGQFVVFYIYQRCSGLTLESIL